MASSSSSPRTWQYNVFTSFHGPDVRKTFLSHLRKQFNFNGITMFDDQGIERSKIIAPALTQAIRGSRISIIVLSKKYASSSWCLDELLEIMKCRKELGQRVMTVFYDVDPSDVRNQTGDFGITFRKTCARKKEQRRKWSQALTDVGNIAGEHFLKWENEAEMIEKIARDVSGKLNATPCRDFDDMVGLDNHLKEMESLLDLNNTHVKVVGISGPAGIGKSTIARALHSRLSNRFQHTCFLENLRDNYKIGRDGYGLKLSLHKHLLSKILNQNSMQISNLGVIKQRLHDKKVLIILDDVESLDQLETLANIIWFGAGSRVIVTTENKEILQRHGINDIYHVGFPSSREALMIFCLSAFRQNSPPDGFMNLAVEIAKISGNLPLGLRILGLSLRGKSQTDWIDELPRLKNCLNGDIERVLKEGYESLHEKDQALFLFIAVFFNYKHVDHVTSVLEKTNLDVRLGLKKLANRHLIHIGHGSKVVMHHLLRVMARQVASQQKLSKHKILVDAKDICDVLQKAEDDGSIKGISFDAAEIDELMINPRAFETMCNLLFLKVYNVGCHTGKRKLHIPVDIEFPCRIRLLHWDRYSGKSLPLRFSPENLVELNMEGSELEKLWEGTKLLGNLKKINLFGSTSLKELPDLSNATNLERLNLSFCKSLEVVPTLVNLASLTWIKMYRCSRLSRFPEIPTNIESLQITAATLEEVPASLTHCSRLKIIEIFNSVNLKTFLTQLPTSVEYINLCYCGIERITDSIKGLHNLRVLYLSSCKRLASLPELPCSLKSLYAENCESLERVNGHLNTPNAYLDFTNCFKLDREARRAIIQQSFGNGSAQLPGIEVPAEFEYRARGSSITIPNFGFIKCRVCIVKAPKSAKLQKAPVRLQKAPVRLQKAHLLMYSIVFDFFDTSSRVFDFKSELQDFDIIECGVQILRDETDGSNNSGSGDEDDESSDKEEEDDDSAIQSESSEVSDKEDDEEGYNSESGEETEESVSRKRPRNLKKWILCLFFVFLFCFLFLL